MAKEIYNVTKLSFNINGFSNVIEVVSGGKFSLPVEFIANENGFISANNVGTETVIEGRGKMDTATFQTLISIWNAQKTEGFFNGILTAYGYIKQHNTQILKLSFDTAILKKMPNPMAEERGGMVELDFSFSCNDAGELSYDPGE